MTEFEKLKQLIADAEEDAKKFYEKGNHAAGTRLRKAMQDIKNQCQAIRTGVSAVKNNG